MQWKCSLYVYTAVSMTSWDLTLYLGVPMLPFSVKNWPSKPIFGFLSNSVILQQINVKMIHLIPYARIQTRDLWTRSLLPFTTRSTAI